MRILMLDLDTLRPDHLGCYGYLRNTSPNIDIVADDGICFTNYYCSDAPCLPSRTALMSGRFGIHTGVVNHGGEAADMRLLGSKRGFKDFIAKECLPAVLQEAGLRTVSISGFAEHHANWTFYAGFSEIYNTKRLGLDSYKVYPIVEDWLNRNAEDDNWFLHVNFWDAHTPYRTPEDFGNPFENEPIEDFFNEEFLEKTKNAVGPHSAKDLNMYDDKEFSFLPRAIGSFQDMKGLKKFIDGYDCGIRFMDEYIGKIINILKDKGIYEETAIIITADHGENFGELDIFGEHATADYATCHLPFILKWPGGRKGVKEPSMRYHLDLLPTFAELLDMPESPRWDGESYKDCIFQENIPGRNEIILSQCSHTCQRAVLFDNYLYIRTYHDGYHLFPKEMLFDLKNDIKEQKNIAKEHLEICKEATYRYLKWHDDMMMSMDYVIDPLWTVMKEGGPFHCRGELSKYIDRLEKTGRKEGANELRKRHPKDL